MKVQDLEIYNLAMELAEDIWEAVKDWEFFAKDTVGKQLVKAADSIAANISEGFGRYSYKENRQFCFYSRGSLSETDTWLQKAENRKLISKATHKSFVKRIDKTGRKLNAYIKSIGQKSNE